MTWSFNVEARRELVDAVKFLGRRASAGCIARRLGKNQATVLQMLYALKADGVVRYERIDGVMHWSATGKPVPESASSTSTQDRRRHDHCALAAALGMPIAPRLIAEPTLIHRIGGAYGRDEA